MKYLKGLLIIAVLAFQGCSKEDNYIPDVPINLNIPVNDYRVSALNSPGGAVIISGYGVAGLILYKKPSGEIVAYDRCSSYNPENKCAVNLDNPTITATDPCSGSVFLLENGYAGKAPATRPLKQYQVYVSSSQISVIN